MFEPRRSQDIGPYAYPEDFEPPDEDELLADLDPETVRYIRDTLTDENSDD